MATKTLGPDVLWKWEDSLDEALRQQLLSAVESTWSFAHMTAWSYLYDEARGPELIEEALDPYGLSPQSPHRGRRPRS